MPHYQSVYPYFDVNSRQDVLDQLQANPTSVSDNPQLMTLVPRNLAINITVSVGILIATAWLGPLLIRRVYSALC
ncbi:hypothetical protein NG895_02650 [Aeoliella sp. ICT_H6.2]|uniref:Uncharacterized protein n=2 Tax=Aeoliella straminimaris TaxID=2954799 RepID=A0A9X2F5U4_9BACT|nr:hypothetical protein [Aeoliella straminimaris]